MYLTADEILPVVKQRLRIQNTDHDAYLLTLIYEGARRLRTTETFVLKEAEHTVENNSFTMPEYAKALVAARANCWDIIAIDYPFFQGCGCTPNQATYPTWYNMMKQNGRTFYFVTPVADGTTVNAVYSMLNTDEDGLLLINEEQEIALISYASYQFALSYPERYTNQQVQMWYKEYQYQAGFARGAAARRTFMNQREQISAKMNSIATIQGYVLNTLFNSFWYRQ